MDPLNQSYPEPSPMQAQEPPPKPEMQAPQPPQQPITAPALSNNASNGTTSTLLMPLCTSHSPSGSPASPDSSIGFGASSPPNISRPNFIPFFAPEHPAIPSSFAETIPEAEEHAPQNSSFVREENIAAQESEIVPLPREFESGAQESFPASTSTDENFASAFSPREDNCIMGDTDLKKGDAVSYQWNGDKKGGTVSEVAKEGSVKMDTKSGNVATKEAKPGDPAIRMERSGHDVVKNASEVQKEGDGESHNEGGVQKEVGKDVGKGSKKEEKKDEKKAEKKDDKDAKTGEKRAAGGESKANGEEEPKKKKGRPAKAEGGEKPAKKETKKKEPKKAATESGEPRRSGRNAGK